MIKESGCIITKNLLSMKEKKKTRVETEMKTVE
jgi:hypothetical protein